MTGCPTTSSSTERKMQAVFHSPAIRFVPICFKVLAVAPAHCSHFGIPLLMLLISPQLSLKGTPPPHSWSVRS